MAIRKRPELAHQGIQDTRGTHYFGYKSFFILLESSVKTQILVDS